MIESLLVANRGEIACRIFRTARRMGIRTIAVFSDADAGAKHVREADEAVWIGPAAPRESYLAVARLIEAAKKANATAVHPGYGFLAENAEFARACADAGLVFVGPPAEAIAAMGSKSVAKARMRAAGVPVLPGYEGERQDTAHLEAEGRRLGLPFIIKPAAGGGGKGMRIVRQEAEIRDALEAARRLAEGSFGEGALLLERYLPAPRHVEVQVFADRHGSIVHLGDRDCSVQRRHQKVIEEALAPAVAPDVRARMRASALLVAREIGYVGAGTVEFLLEGDEFFFMEMNTRLQVEHTVTEAVTGLDLVEWQLRVAGGERLPASQEQITFAGHAIEARVCAEDPERDFIPSAGRLRLMEWPVGESVRADVGFETGDTVPAEYDSLLGKVIAWAPTRSLAAARLADALERTRCAGVRTNERWLSRILRSAAFLEERLSIGFLSDNAGELRKTEGPSSEAVALAALSVLEAIAPGAGSSGQPSELPARGDPGPWDVKDGFTPNLPAVVPVALQWGGASIAANIRFSGREIAEVIIGETDIIPVADCVLTADAIAVRLGDRHVHARTHIDGPDLHVWVRGQHYVFSVNDARTREYASSAAEGDLTTPLPGTVVAVDVSPGQRVEHGQRLMLIEAMKMEHAIVAPYDGTVRTVHFARGDRVPEGSSLLELARAPA